MGSAYTQDVMIGTTFWKNFIMGSTLKYVEVNGDLGVQGYEWEFKGNRHIHNLSTNVHEPVEGSIVEET